MKLDDAKVLVTGGSSGIGLDVARLLVERGARWRSRAATRRGSGEAAGRSAPWPCRAT